MRPLTLLLTLSFLAASALPVVGDEAGSTVVAVVGGEPVTLEQVDAHAGPQLHILKDQLHWTRVAAAEDLIGRRLLEAEAKRQGLSFSEFLEKEVRAKVPEPTPEDIAAFWRANAGAAPPEQRAELNETVKNILMRERSGEFRDALVQRLRSEREPKLEIRMPSVRASLELGDRPAKGPAGAPVTLAAFTDYQCGGCAALVKDLEALARSFAGQIRIVHVDYPSESHDRAVPAAIAARCAGRFGKYWEYHDRAFDDVTGLSDERLTAIAVELDLDAEGFAECRAQPDVVAGVEADQALGRELGVTGTPHVFLNGLSLPGGLPAQQLGQLIAMELERLGVPPPRG